MVSTAFILKNITKQLHIESAVKLSELEEKWEQIFDKSISGHIYPADIKDDTLLIKVDSAVWMQQLSYLKSEIKERLSNFSPQYSFKEIVFKLGRFPTNKVQGRHKNTDISTDSIDEIVLEQKSQNLPEWAKELLNEVKDSYLHDRIRNIIVFNLSNQQGDIR
ncbi:MAG: DUF721 domain-containing protein [Thermodesulfovibrionales bacterium]|nr:DUF721 domain-containing protein [Thermodesulfovibrionales bacterium]